MRTVRVVADFPAGRLPGARTYSTFVVPSPVSPVTRSEETSMTNTVCSPAVGGSLALAPQLQPTPPGPVDTERVADLVSQLLARTR
ncbi:hypothetical protein [Kibdelosporangium philippinense]|uniref:hypothetical protein n=1 Tax=Kibdelosporangium philippinense TaxID=211113 RepID=UPI00362373B5